MSFAFILIQPISMKRHVCIDASMNWLPRYPLRERGYQCLSLLRREMRKPDCDLQSPVAPEDEAHVSFSVLLSLIRRDSEE